MFDEHVTEVRPRPALPLIVQGSERKYHHPPNPVEIFEGVTYVAHVSHSAMCPKAAPWELS